MFFGIVYNVMKGTGACFSVDSCTVICYNNMRYITKFLISFLLFHEANKNKMLQFGSHRNIVHFSETDNGDVEYDKKSNTIVLTVAYQNIGIQIVGYLTGADLI